MMDRFRTIFRRAAPIIEPAAVSAREVGWIQSSMFSGDFPKYNPDELMGRKGSGIYRKMMIDEQVKAVTRFKRDAITGREFSIEWPSVDGADVKPGSEENRRIEIYEEMVRQTFGSFVDGMNFILMAMYQGFSMTEKIIEPFNFKGRPYLGLQQLIPKPFDTFEFKVDKFGTIERTIQKINMEEQIIDLNRFVYYVQNPEFDQHYGQSDLREAYRSWYSKDVVIRFYNQFLERFAGGFVVASPTGNNTIIAGTPEYNSLIAAMNGIQTQSSVLLPNGIELDVQRPNTTDQFEKAIALHDLGIAKALLVPNLLGITPQAATSGGFAQANTQLEAFLWTLDADATRLEEVINEQIFIPLSTLNFADGQGPLFRFKPISETKKLELIKTWNELVQAGATEASDTDEHHIREMLNFPHKGEPLNLQAKAAAVTSEMPDGSGQRVRGPVKKTGEPRKRDRQNNKRAFAKAEKRVAFQVIDRKASKIEDDGIIMLELKIGDMVADLTTRIKHEKWGTPAAGISGINSIDFNPRQKSKVNKALTDTLQQAWALGVQHSKSEIAAARQESFSINFGRIDEEAAEWLKLNGFRAVGRMSDDMKAIIQGVLVNGIKFSWTPDDIERRIYDQLTSAGFITVATNADATGRAIDTVEEAIDGTGALARVRTSIRTNVFDAINEARYSTFTDPALAGFVEALEYSAILDSRTTNICRHMDDRVYPMNSEVWNSHRPPNHFNCRSILVPVTAIDTDVTGKDLDPTTGFSRSPSIEPQSGFGGTRG